MLPPDSFHALALDPGGTTGVCHVYTSMGALVFTVSEHKLSHHQLALTIAGHTHVVYETFAYRNAPRPNLDLIPVELIGVIKLVAQREPEMMLYPQSPADGKAFYTDDRLKQSGLWKVGKPHGRDATRHMLRWMKFGAGAQYLDIDAIIESRRFLLV